MSEYENDQLPADKADSPERRAFLKKAGRFATVTPIAATVILSTSMEADATGLFKSGGDAYKKKMKLKKLKGRKKAIKSKIKKFKSHKRA